MLHSAYAFKRIQRAADETSSPRSHQFSPPPSPFTLPEQTRHSKSSQPLPHRSPAYPPRRQRPAEVRAHARHSQPSVPSPLSSPGRPRTPHPPPESSPETRTPHAAPPFLSSRPCAHPAKSPPRYPHSNSKTRRYHACCKPPPAPLPPPQDRLCRYNPPHPSKETHHPGIRKPLSIAETLSWQEPRLNPLRLTPPRQANSAVRHSLIGCGPSWFKPIARPPC